MLEGTLQGTFEILSPIILSIDPIEFRYRIVKGDHKVAFELPSSMVFWDFKQTHKPPYRNLKEPLKFRFP